MANANAKTNAKKVSVTLADWRMSAFDPKMRGIDKITHTPQEIDASKYEELEKRASKVGVLLKTANTEQTGESTEEEGE